MATRKKNKEKKRSFILMVSITGKVHVYVEADDVEDAKRALWAGEGHDGFTEWEYNDILSVMENT